MRTIISFFFLAVLACSTYAQQTKKELPARNDVFKYVEQMPVYEYDINEYIKNNLRYPDSAIAKNIQGRIYLQFIVEKDGSISSVEIAGNKRLGAGCEEEAIRVISSMPPWKPGKTKRQACERILYAARNV